jgi:hypothetical protein
MALVLIRAVADFTEAVKEYGPADGVLLLALVETEIATTTQLGVLVQAWEERGRVQDLPQITAC